MGILGKYESEVWEYGEACGIQVYEPARAWLRGTPLHRRRQRSGQPMRYVAWQLFLLFFLIGWIITYWGMDWGYYGNRPRRVGLEHRLIPAPVTAKQVQWLLDGEATTDPAAEVVVLRVAESGAVTWNGEPYSIRHGAWPDVEPKHPGGEVIILIQAIDGATYQQVVDVLDWVVARESYGHTPRWNEVLVTSAPQE